MPKQLNRVRARFPFPAEINFMNLADTELDLWLWELKRPAGEFLEQDYSAEQWERGSRYRSPDKRRQFLSSRRIGREILSHYLDCAPREIDWSLTGPPRIRGGGQGLSISLSHSGHLGAFTVARWPHGVDLECCVSSLNLHALAATALTLPERQRLEQIPPPARELWLRRMWTMKESVLKSLSSEQLPGPKEVCIDDRSLRRIGDHCLIDFQAVLSVSGEAPPPVVLCGCAWTVDSENSVCPGAPATAAAVSSAVAVGAITLGPVREHKIPKPRVELQEFDGTEGRERVAKENLQDWVLSLRCVRGRILAVVPTGAVEQGA